MGIMSYGSSLAERLFNETYKRGNGLLFISTDPKGLCCYLDYWDVNLGCFIYNFIRPSLKNIRFYSVLTDHKITFH